MKVWINRIGTVLALAFLALTFVNASWIAGSPHGTVKLIAHRGAHQQFDRAGLKPRDCPASRIAAPYHHYLENTLGGVDAAVRSGAQMVQVDIAPTKDGGIALYHETTLDCRTDGKGNVRDHTMAELAALDAGHGYTADGGQTFPLRGRGQIPPLEDVTRMVGRRFPLLYTFNSDDPTEADALAAALQAAGRDATKAGDSFMGPPAPIARIRQLYPKAWTLDRAQAQACTRDYLWMGWLAITPESCRGATVLVPLNYQWAFAGWPSRMTQRMEKVGARMILMGPYSRDSAPMGLDLPEQLADIPADFTGYVWVDDIWAVGPALREETNPYFDDDLPNLEAALAARRKARGAE